MKQVFNFVVDQMAGAEMSASKFFDRNRARTQQKLNEMIQTVVNQVIPKIEEALPHLGGQDTQVVVEIRNFYCGLHNLVHMAEVNE